MTFNRREAIPAGVAAGVVAVMPRRGPAVNLQRFMERFLPTTPG
jgi:hypothetical protein